MSERNLCRRFSVGIVCLAGTTFLASSAAGAAGNGYGPTAPPSAVIAGFTSVVEAQNITPAGGIITGSYAGESFTITIPPHALHRTQEVVITAPDLRTLNVGKIRPPSQALGSHSSIRDLDASTERR